MQTSGAFLANSSSQFSAPYSYNSVQFNTPMSENKPESFDDAQDEVDNKPLESQVQNKDDLPEEEEERDPSSEKCLLWTNWHFFILPKRLEVFLKKKEAKESGEDSGEEESEEPEDFDRYVPKTKNGRLIGVMQYILHEEGRILIEEMLFIDVVLRRIMAFEPFMPGVDRYDEMGVLQLWHGMRRFINDFFVLDPKRRREILEEFKDNGRFSPEILHEVKRLNNLVDIPKVKKAPVESSPEGKPVRCWPDKLSGRDLELFKLLSGIESVSPRNQALSVLNYIFSKDSASTSLGQDAGSADSSASEEMPEPIRFEPGDKERIERLLKRFPGLKNRYPYLLRMIEKDIPVDQFNARSDEQEHFFNDALSSKFYFPLVLADPPKNSILQKLFSKWYIKWSIITASIFLMLLLLGILYVILSQVAN